MRLVSLRGMSRAVAVGAVLLLINACKKPDAAPPSKSEGTAVVSGASGASGTSGASSVYAKMTPNELKWGISPTRNDKVTYQDNVIIMEHGADAVKAMATNGLFWTIDANAPHADEIKVNKILFATGRVMGRVLAVTRKGDGLEVLLGPVEITEVIKDADLQADQPIDLDNALVYTAPDYPGAANHPVESEPTSLAEPTIPAFFAAYTPPLTLQSQSYIGAAKEITINGYTIKPACCHSFGIRLLFDGKGVKLTAKANLYVPAGAGVRFKLLIVKSQIIDANVELYGSSGMEIGFEAGTNAGIAGNINAQNIIIPADITIPIGGMAVPFSAVFRQSLTLTTIFTAQNGTVNATGKYEFSGSIKAGKVNGGEWGVTVPTEYVVKQNLTNSISGVSLGANGLVFGYGAKVIVGIGAFGFVTGPFVTLNPVVGIRNGSSMTVAGMPPCRSGSLDVNSRYGVGWQIPAWSAELINVFLRPFTATQIKSEGGSEYEKPVKHISEVFPAGCGGEPTT
jgi:hypothetical protein